MQMEHANGTCTACIVACMHAHIILVICLHILIVYIVCGLIKYILMFYDIFNDCY